MADFDLLFKIGWIVSVIVAAVSAICTMFTLLLIRDINRWNTYMLLIFHLTACQMLGDIAFFFVPVDIEKTIYFQIQVFFYTLGAVSVSLWTNVISCSLFSVVIFQENLSISENFWMLRVLVMIPGLVLGVMFAVLVNKNYDAIVSAVIWVLMLSIIFNLGVHCTVSYALRQMALEDEEEAECMTIETNSVEDGAEKANAPITAASSPVSAADMRTSYPAKINVYEPILELAKRLQYYPIVQILAILGQLWYFLQFEFNYWGPQDNASLKLVAWYMYSVLTPSTGLGYFIVFLTVQPYAYNHFRTRLRQLFGKPADRSLSIQSDTSYREPSSTTMRVTETDQLPPRFSNYSVDSASSAGQGWSQFTTTSLSTMDEDALMRRIRDTHRANQALQEQQRTPSMGGGSGSISLGGGSASMSRSSGAGNPLHSLSGQSMSGSISQGSRMGPGRGSVEESPL